MTDNLPLTCPFCDTETYDIVHLQQHLFNIHEHNSIWEMCGILAKLLQDTEQSRNKATKQEWIPLSVVDAKIKQQEDFGIKYNNDYTQQKKDMVNHNYTDYDVKTKIRLATIYHLKAIKKEAITPEPLEQKIKNRIKELESEKYQLGWSETFEQRRNLIDELRKLLK